MYKFHILIQLLIFYFFQNNFIHCTNDDNTRLEMITRSENSSVQFLCDLNDVAWWKRPNLLATRYGVILPKFRWKMSIENSPENPSKQILTIEKLQSNDSGVYECETLGAMREFNLTVTVRLSTVELGVQYESTNEYLFNSNLSYQSLLLNNRYISLRENQFIRLTCVVSRAFPAASLHFPFDVDYRLERNSTIENDDKTYRTILVLIIRIDRFFHKRLFHCQATQYQPIANENKQEQIRIHSNTLQMDVTYSPRCSQTIPSIPQIFTGINRPINLTCHMHNGNPTKINFTWHLPNGNSYLGENLNTTSNYLTYLPTTETDFGQIICRAQNELGLTGQCYLNMSLGGIPDPIKSCHYTYLNSTLTVNCLAGYHQGDEDFFCYMYKRQQNGTYSEHARLKGNCAFILPDLKPDYHHDFRVFAKNKFGDNFDQSYSIKVGKPRVETFAERTRTYLPYMSLCIIGVCLLSLFLFCCICQRIRKAMYIKNKSKGNFDLTYENSNGKTSHPIRPYRSKDYLICSEPSTLHRTNPLPPPLKSLYSTDDETHSNRRSILKETDLDQIIHPSNGTIKTLSSNRNRTLYSKDESNDFVSIQRRPSFQEATKFSTLDFYNTASEPFYFLDKQLTKTSQRNHYSPYANRQSKSLILENQMITNSSDQYDEKFIRKTDDGIFV